MSFNTGISPHTALQFQFITVQSLGEARNPAHQRLVRSHALRQSLRAKRKRAQERQENFRFVVPQHPTKSLCQRRVRGDAEELPATIAGDKLDPFDSLAVDSSRLQAFLSNEAARQAGEPIFSLKKDCCFLSVADILHIGLNDPALMNALMLTLAFTVNGFKANVESLSYKGDAIYHLNQKIRCSKDAAGESTIRAILLLAGVESRLGLRSDVQIHMNGVRKLLEVCESQNIHLGAATKRAVFWQDLNSALMTGSERIITHETFPELAWSRDSFCDSVYTLPAGFIPMTHLFSDNILSIFEDIHALQCMRDSPTCLSQDAVTTLQLDNQQAWIESRIYESRLRLSRNDHLLGCCLIIGYLCTYLMYTDVWHGNLIPQHCSSQLLQKLQQTSATPEWTGKEDMLLWLVCMGGAFATRGTMSTEYSVLMNETYYEQLQPLTGTWENVESCLKMFLWSEKAFQKPCKVFWAETCSP